MFLDSMVKRKKHVGSAFDTVFCFNALFRLNKTFTKINLRQRRDRTDLKKPLKYNGDRVQYENLKSN